MLPEHERREGWTSPPSLYRPDRSIDCPRRGRSRRSTDRPRGSTVCLPRRLAFESSPQARRPRAKADRRTQSAMTAKHLEPPGSHVEHGRLIRNHQTCTGATLSMCRHTATRHTKRPCSDGARSQRSSAAPNRGGCRGFGGSHARRIPTARLLHNRRHCGQHGSRPSALAVSCGLTEVE